MFIFNEEKLDTSTFMLGAHVSKRNFSLEICLFLQTRSRGLLIGLDYMHNFWIAKFVHCESEARCFG